MKNTLQVPVKFINGDKLYTTKKVKVQIPCSICEGEGTIKYNNKDMRCPECVGVGYFTAKKAITHIVHEKPFVIKQTKIVIDNDGKTTIKYRGHCGTEILNRSVDNLFLTREEAQIRCDELNENLKLVNVEDIQIQEVFKENAPSPDKVINKIAYYKENGKFAKPIRVNKDNVLQDGYIDYLICKTFNINTTKVSIV